VDWNTWAETHGRVQQDRLPGHLSRQVAQKKKQKNGQSAEVFLRRFVFVDIDKID